ncbi:MAG: hypothetical protein M0033_11050 [Nitrospiraceae bacterium]|nr:hypothetical protein [Nitrospiraceae bacterium]
MTTKEYQIFNLTDAPKSFKAGNYNFEQLPDYEARKHDVYRPTTIHEHFDEDGGEEKQVIEKIYGKHTNTYVAKSENEPPSLLWDSSRQIDDVILVLRLLTGQCVCLDHEVEIWWHYGKADHIVPSTIAPRFIDNAIKPEILGEFRKYDAHIAAYFYLRAWQGTCLNFQIADLGIAWDILSSGYDQREKDKDFQKRKKEFLSEAGALLQGLGAKHGSDLAGKAQASITNISLFSLADRIVHIVTSLGVLPNVPAVKLREQAYIFSAIRGTAVHDGTIPNKLKKFPVPKRAIRYYAFVFRSLMSVVYGKLLGIANGMMAQNIKDVENYFLTGEFRGEKPFREEDSRIEAEIRQIIAEDAGN